MEPRTFQPRTVDIARYLDPAGKLAAPVYAFTRSVGSGRITTPSFEPTAAAVAQAVEQLTAEQRDTYDRLHTLMPDADLEQRVRLLRISRMSPLERERFATFQRIARELGTDGFVFDGPDAPWRTPAPDAPVPEPTAAPDFDAGWSNPLDDSEWAAVQAFMPKKLDRRGTINWRETLDALIERHECRLSLTTVPALWKRVERLGVMFCWTRLHEALPELPLSADRRRTLTALCHVGMRAGKKVRARPSHMTGH